MEDQRLLFLALFLVVYFVASPGVLVSAAEADWRPSPLSTLFVFGDSYVATGNNWNVDRRYVDPDTMSWHYPYGITFPEKPSGRYSDGRVLTDFIAQFIGVKSPISSKFRKYATSDHLKDGINFAYGGTGVTGISGGVYPNMTTQIDSFRKLVKHSVFTATDLRSAVALVTFAGDEYTKVLSDGDAKGWETYIALVLNQLAHNLKRIYDVGVKKVLVTALPPMGCFPLSTAKSSFQKCNTTQNSLVRFHNLLLKQAVAKLNNQTKDSSFIVLDLYASFMSVFKNKGDALGNIKFKNPLKQCCIGKGDGNFCGSIDEVRFGETMYTVCDPKTAFFWDDTRPTQQGWRVVYSTLQASLEQLYY